MKATTLSWTTETEVEYESAQELLEQIGADALEVWFSTRVPVRRADTAKQGQWLSTDRGITFHRVRSLVKGEELARLNRLMGRLRRNGPAVRFTDGTWEYLAALTELEVP